MAPPLFGFVWQNLPCMGSPCLWNFPLQKGHICITPAILPCFCHRWFTSPALVCPAKPHPASSHFSTKGSDSTQSSLLIFLASLLSFASLLTLQIRHWAILWSKKLWVLTHFQRHTHTHMCMQTHTHKDPAGEKAVDLVLYGNQMRSVFDLPIDIHVGKVLGPAGRQTPYKYYRQNTTLTIIPYTCTCNMHTCTCNIHTCTLCSTGQLYKPGSLLLALSCTIL